MYYVFFCVVPGIGFCLLEVLRRRMNPLHGIGKAHKTCSIDETPQDNMAPIVEWRHNIGLNP